MRIYLFGFICFVLIIMIEEVLHCIWSIVIFKSGIPIYQRIYEGDFVSFDIKDNQIIEALLPSKKTGKTLVKYVKNNFFIFREHARRFKFYNYGSFGIMHGNIIIEPQKGKVKVIGRLNWSALYGIPFLLIHIYSLPILITTKILTLMFVLFVLTLMFLSHKNNYDEIAQIISKNLKKIAEGGNAEREEP